MRGTVATSSVLALGILASEMPKIAAVSLLLWQLFHIFFLSLGETFKE